MEHLHQQQHRYHQLVLPSIAKCTVHADGQPLVRGQAWLPWMVRRLAPSHLRQSPLQSENKECKASEIEQQ
jgi:hypothetical protein